MKYYVYGIEVVDFEAFKHWKKSNTYKNAKERDSIWALAHNENPHGELQHLREAGISLVDTSASKYLSDWYLELNNIAKYKLKESIEIGSVEAYEDYYINGYLPMDALRADVQRETN